MFINGVNVNFCMSLNAIIRTLSCCAQNPFLLRGMLVSILLRTSVILGVTRQTWARPSCMTTAATSAWRVTSQASSTTWRDRRQALLHDDSGNVSVTRHVTGFIYNMTRQTSGPPAWRQRRRQRDASRHRLHLQHDETDVRPSCMTRHKLHLQHSMTTHRQAECELMILCTRQHAVCRVGVLRGIL